MKIGLKKTLKFTALLALLQPAFLFASGDGEHITHIKIDVSNKNTLQLGAKHFTNYCMGCHSVKFSSYKKLQKDLALTESQILKNLMMSHGDEKKISSYMLTSMTKKQGKLLFGNSPPDLSTISRSKGVDWLYSYLTTFYVDANRPFGMNNLVFKDVSMPHALVELQGQQIKVEKEVNGKTVVSFKIDPNHPGRLSQTEYKQVVKELVTFLAYIGEPTKVARHQLGVWVLLFLVVFTILAYFLKKEYWRDIH